jgi:hypothetical protein
MDDGIHFGWRGFPRIEGILHSIISPGSKDKRMNCHACEDEAGIPLFCQRLLYPSQ